jgi:hypothetical protein
MRAPHSAATALTTLLASCVFAAEEPDLSWIDRPALEAGEILVDTDRGDRLTVHIKLATRIDASLEDVWRELTSCEIAPEYLPNIQSCRSLEVIEDGRAELFVQVIKPPLFLPAFEHVYRLDYQPYERIDSRRVSGPIERMDGTWWLLPEDDGAVLLVYELDLDPGVPVPRFFVRATLRRDLPRLLAAVRDRAEASR